MTGQAMDMSRRRVLIASNRLPVTVTLKEGALKFSKSSGGLVSALSSVLANTAHKWIGWPGAVIPQDSVNEVEKTLLRDYSAVPVFLSEELHVRFVNGFSSEHTHNVEPSII